MSTRLKEPNAWAGFAWALPVTAVMVAIGIGFVVALERGVIGQSAFSWTCWILVGAGAVFTIGLFAAIMRAEVKMGKAGNAQWAAFCVVSGRTFLPYKLGRSPHATFKHRGRDVICDSGRTAGRPRVVVPMACIGDEDYLGLEVCPLSTMASLGYPKDGYTETSEFGGEATTVASSRALADRILAVPGARDLLLKGFRDFGLGTGAGNWFGSPGVGANVNWFVMEPEKVLPAADFLCDLADVIEEALAVKDVEAEGP